jgi:hypothetical protein
LEQIRTRLSGKAVLVGGRSLRVGNHDHSVHSMSVAWNNAISRRKMPPITSHGRSIREIAYDYSRTSAGIVVCFRRLLLWGRAIWC